MSKLKNLSRDDLLSLSEEMLEAIIDIQEFLPVKFVSKHETLAKTYMGRAVKKIIDVVEKCN